MTKSWACRALKGVYTHSWWLGGAGSPIRFAVKESTDPGVHSPGWLGDQGCVAASSIGEWMVWPREPPAVGSPSYSQAFCQKIGVTRVVGFSQEQARLNRTPQGTSDRATFPGARK